MLEFLARTGLRYRLTRRKARLSNRTNATSRTTHTWRLTQDIDIALTIIEKTKKTIGNLGCQGNQFD